MYILNDKNGLFLLFLFFLFVFCEGWTAALPLFLKFQMELTSINLKCRIYGHLVSSMKFDIIIPAISFICNNKPIIEIHRLTLFTSIPQTFLYSKWLAQEFSEMKNYHYYSLIYATGIWRSFRIQWLWRIVIKTIIWINQS